MPQTYSTRHLTARDHRLIDVLEQVPRFRVLAERLRPPTTKPVKPAPTRPAEPPAEAVEPVAKPKPSSR